MLAKHTLLQYSGYKTFLLKNKNKCRDFHFRHFSLELELIITPQKNRSEKSGILF